MRRIFKVFVVRLQKAEVETIHLKLRQQIRTEQNTVRIFQKKGACAVRLPSQFRRSGADINLKIGKSVELLGKISQILSAFSTMRPNKSRRRMSRDNAVALLKQVAFCNRQMMKSPIWMCSQFFIAFIMSINRVKERTRISGVKHYGQSQLSACLKDRGEAVIIDT